MSRKAKKRLFAGAWMILALVSLFGLVLTHGPRDVLAELYNVWTRPLILNTTSNDTSLIMSDSLIVKGSARVEGALEAGTFVIDALDDAVIGGVTPAAGTFTTLGATDDVSIAATKKLYLDGGSNTYITESAGDDISIYTAGTEQVVIDGNGKATFTDTIVAEKGIRIGTGSWTLPVADGDADQVLTTDGAGGVTWEDGGGGGGGSSYKLIAEDGDPDSVLAVNDDGNVILRREDNTINDGNYIFTVKNEDATYNECAGMKIQAGRNGQYALYIVGGNGSTHFMDLGKYGGYVGFGAANAGSQWMEVNGGIQAKWILKATTGGQLQLYGTVPGDMTLNSGSFGGQNWWYWQANTQIMRIDDPNDYIAMYNPSDKDFVKQWSVYNGSTYSGVNAGDGSWSTSSSRTMKEDIREVNYKYLLPDGPTYALDFFEEPLQFAAKDSATVKKIMREKRVILSPPSDSLRVSMLDKLRHLKVRSFKWNLDASFPEGDTVIALSHQDPVTHEAVYDTTIHRFRDKAKARRANNPKSQEAKTHLGLIAEEFYPIAKAMGYEGDSTRVNWGYVRMMMLMSMKEQDEEIGVLRGRVSTMEELHLKLLNKVDSLALVVEGR